MNRVKGLPSESGYGVAQIPQSPAARVEIGKATIASRLARGASARLIDAQKTPEITYQTPVRLIVAPRRNNER